MKGKNGKRCEIYAVETSIVEATTVLEKQDWNIRFKHCVFVCVCLSQLYVDQFVLHGVHVGRVALGPSPRQASGRPRKAMIGQSHVGIVLMTEQPLGRATSSAAFEATQAVLVRVEGFAVRVQEVNELIAFFDFLQLVLGEPVARRSHEMDGWFLVREAHAAIGTTAATARFAHVDGTRRSQGRLQVILVALDGCGDGVVARRKVHRAKNRSG